MKMEIGKTYEVVFAETNDGEFESENMELIEIKEYKGKEIYIFENSIGEMISYNHNKNIDWDFMNEISEKFRKR